MRWMAIPLALIVLSAAAHAADSTKVSIKVDTSLFVPSPNDRDSSLVIDTTDFERHLYQNPTAGLFKSMFVPGLGQLGNHRYFKAMLFAGLEGYFVSRALHYNHQAQGYRAQYDAATTVADRDNFYGLYKSRRDSRNTYYWFTGLTIFVSMFDAFVDAHLSGSPMAKRNEKVGLTAGPDGRGGTAVQLALRF